MHVLRSASVMVLFGLQHGVRGAVGCCLFQITGFLLEFYPLWFRLLFLENMRIVAQ